MWTPLKFAVNDGKTEIVTVLINNGPILDAIDEVSIKK